MPEIQGQQKTADNGWRLASVWDGQETTGDYTVGDELIAYYEAPGTPYTAELTFYVTATGDHPDMSPGSPLDNMDDLAEAENVRYAVDQRFEFYDEPPADSSGPIETDYDGGSYRYYSTVEEANQEARRMALNNIDWTFQKASEIKVPA